MSIIQSIRDRAAVLVFAVIAISLIGFLVQDAFIGRSRGIFSGPVNAVGSINGKEIELNDYAQKLKAAEENYQARGMNLSDDMRQRIQEQIWGNYVEESLVKTECAKLGIVFSPKELGTLLFSDDAPQEFKQQFTDPKTGIYDVEAAREAFRNLQKSKNAEQLKAVNDQLLDPISINEMRSKYISLFSGGAYVPKWLSEKMNAENSALANVSYVATSYNTISDSLASVKVSDAEIADYVQKHKEEFKQENTRNIAYVLFDASPSPRDSAVQRSQVENLKAGFVAAEDSKAYLTRNGSTIAFLDGYVQKSKMQMAAKDSIINLPIGQVYGPYLDGGSYVLAKKLDTRQIPDSVKCRHILIGTMDPSTGQAIRADSVAKKRADSIAIAIQSGNDFKLLAAQFSDDQGSKTRGGEYDYSSSQFSNITRPFAEAIFYGKTGDKKVIKTEFGYHYVEVVSQKNFDEGIKVAYLSKTITTGKETDDSVSSAATQFAASSRDLKSFDENIRKNKSLNKRLGDDIHENDFSIQPLGPSRSLVRWIFENKVGTVSEPFNVGDKYVVVSILKAKEEGIQQAEDARIAVEPILRNQKKAAEIIKKMGNPASLESLAADNKTQVLKADSISFGSTVVPQVGNEPKLIGAAFNKQFQGKVSAPIPGNSAVFVIKPESIGSKAGAATDGETLRKRMQMQLRQMDMYSATQSLRLAATIKDKRRLAGY